MPNRRKRPPGKQSTISRHRRKQKLQIDSNWNQIQMRQIRQQTNSAECSRIHKLRREMSIQLISISKYHYLHLARTGLAGDSVITL